MSGWSGAPGLAPRPGAKEASWPGYMVGTLWADKVLPGERAREAKRQEGTGRDSRHKHTHTHTSITER